MVDIGALFGQSSGASTPSIPALATFKRLVKTRNTQIDAFAKQAKMQKDVEYFKSKIGSIENPEQLVKDRRLLTFVTSAFGLDGEEKNGGKIRRILESDLKDERSFANRQIDPRFKQLAEAFKFKEFGNFYLKQSMFVNDVVNRYVRNEFEKSLGDKNPTLREAAYFLRTIGGVTDTSQILGDKVLRSIVTTALGLPPEIVNQSVEKQKALGGTCLLWGCIPTKALLEHAHALKVVQQSSEWGISTGSGTATINMPQVQDRKDKIVSGLTKGIEFLFKKNKIDWIKGAGSIPAAGRVAVKLSGGGERA